MKLLLIGFLLFNYFSFSQEGNTGEFSTFDNITKNMSKNEVLDLIEDINFQEYSITSESKSYNIVVCKRHTYIEASTPFYEFFVIAFSEDKSYFWGRISDFKSNENDSISKLGVDISEYIIKNEVE